MFPFPLLLASAPAGDASDLFGDILPWLIVLLALVLVGGGIIYFVKRVYAGGPGTSSEAFTLQGLRDLRASGQITDEEFERARTAMIGRLKAGPADVEPSADAPEADDNGENASGNGDEPKNSV